MKITIIIFLEHEILILNRLRLTDISIQSLELYHSQSTFCQISSLR